MLAFTTPRWAFSIPFQNLAWLNQGHPPNSSLVPNHFMIVRTLKTQPFMLTLSKHERRSGPPFEKLRVNDDSQTNGNRVREDIR
jgi:hypothetical protein